MIRSPGIDRAVTFYEAMGLTFEKHSHGNGPEHYASEMCGFVFEIYPARNAGENTTTARIGFNVDDVDSVVAMVCDVGGTVRFKPNDTEWGRRAVVHDIDGHIVELTTPPNREQRILADHNARTPDGGQPSDAPERRWLAFSFSYKSFAAAR